MRRGSPPVAGTVKIVVGGLLLGVAGAFAAREIHEAGFPADEQRTHLARDDQRVFRVAISMATMPAVPSAITKRPSGVMLF